MAAAPPRGPRVQGRAEGAPGYVSADRHVDEA
jgi:hypothetical protein